ncbi:hypothetical protein BKA61DRAFT_719822 [Leptodontidium sp. MPI-SDFR-AT-0119]|nr:hypothetical protein BKA61DRAFT_719822 [Leptodontidium sp. MPI-SDFR-AT-0119]
MPRLVWLKAEKIDPFSNYETPQIGQYFGIKDYMAKSVVASTHLAKKKPSNFVQGVGIASKGDVMLHGRMKFTEVQVPLGHPIFASKSTEISNYMGIPPLVKKIGVFSKDDLDNGYKLGINRERWGYADFIEWDKTIGTVLVVRQDKAAITSPQVEAITSFCKLELYGNRKGKQEIRKMKDQFLKVHMGKKAFENYLYEMKQRKIDAGDGASENATSPYLAKAWGTGFYFLDGSDSSRITLVECFEVVQIRVGIQKPGYEKCNEMHQMTPGKASIWAFF